MAPVANGTSEEERSAPSLSELIEAPRSMAEVANGASEEELSVCPLSEPMEESVFDRLRREGGLFSETRHIFEVDYNVNQLPGGVALGKWRWSVVVVDLACVRDASEFATSMRYDQSNSPHSPLVFGAAAGLLAAGFPSEVVDHLGQLSQRMDRTR